MPKGCPTATMAINGAFNAGLFAASIIGTFDMKVRSNLEKWKRLQTKLVKKKPIINVRHYFRNYRFRSIRIIVMSSCSKN